MPGNYHFVSTVYLAACIAASAAAAYVATHSPTDFMQPAATRSVSMRDLLSRRLAVQKVDVAAYQEFKWHLKMQAKMKAAEEPQNLFATAPLNTGIRLETNSQGISAFVLGLGADGKVTGVRTPNLRPTQIYRIEAQASRSGLQWTINGIQENHQFRLKELPSFSDVVLGNGYDLRRPFAGEILEFESDIAYYRISRIIQGLYDAVSLALFAFALFAGFQFGRRIITLP